MIDFENFCSNKNFRSEKKNFEIFFSSKFFENPVYNFSSIMIGVTLKLYSLHYVTIFFGLDEEFTYNLGYLIFDKDFNKK